jgi:hypothetical protein
MFRVQWDGVRRIAIVGALYYVKILLGLEMLDVSQCCAEGTRGSVIQSSSMKRAFSPS